eukprot:13123469-Heterocapsa_arctica.AAC.1
MYGTVAIAGPVPVRDQTRRGPGPCGGRATGSGAGPVNVRDRSLCGAVPGAGPVPAGTRLNTGPELVPVRDRSGTGPDPLRDRSRCGS